MDRWAGLCSHKGVRDREVILITITDNIWFYSNCIRSDLCRSSALIDQSAVHLPVRCMSFACSNSAISRARNLGSAVPAVMA